MRESCRATEKSGAADAWNIKCMKMEWSKLIKIIARVKLKQSFLQFIDIFH